MQKKHKIFASLLAMCFGAMTLRWKSLKLLQTPQQCKHVPLQTLPCGKFRAVRLACRFNWPRSPVVIFGKMESNSKLCQLFIGPAS